MNSLCYNFNLNLTKYQDNKIIINVKNLNILIEFENFNNKIPIKDFNIILTIQDNILSNDIINPDYNHIYYLDSYTTKINSNLLLRYNILALSIVGLIIKEILLKNYNITFFTHINSVGNISDTVSDYNILFEDLFKFKYDKLPIVDQRAKILIQKIINKSVNDHKVISGSLETIIYNLPKGLGIPYFNLFESTVAKLLYSIPELKSLEFANVSKINNNLIQPYKNISFEKDKLTYESNIYYGVEQGITTGDYVLFKTHFIPPLIYNENSKSINYNTLENILIEPIKQEYFNLHKYIFQVEALTAIALYDLILTK